MEPPVELIPVRAQQPLDCRYNAQRISASGVSMSLAQVIRRLAPVYAHRAVSGKGSRYQLLRTASRRPRPFRRWQSCRSPWL